MKLTYSTFLAVLFASLLLPSQGASANIDIDFNYRYDSSGFFTGANSSRRNLLEAAASAFETRFQDNLTAISPSGSNTFDVSFFQPDNGNDARISNFNVAADQIIVFVGAYNIPGTLAVGGPGGFSAGGSSPFLENARGRGQEGALLSPPADYGPWGGAISFNSASNWYFDPDTRTTEPFANKYDFYSVALHELAHVLGFGTAKSFDNVTSGNMFTGTTVNDLLGFSPTLSGGHWTEGLSYLGQEAAMDPGITPNLRKYFTELDYSAMNDIGWQVSTIPEMEIWAMMLTGLGLLGWSNATRRRG